MLNWLTTQLSVYTDPALLLFEGHDEMASCLANENFARLPTQISFHFTQIKSRLSSHSTFLDGLSIAKLRRNVSSLPLSVASFRAQKRAGDTDFEKLLSVLTDMIHPRVFIFIFKELISTSLPIRLASLFRDIESISIMSSV